MEYLFPDAQTCLQHHPNLTSSQQHLNPVQEPQSQQQERDPQREDNNFNDYIDY